MNVDKELTQRLLAKAGALKDSQGRRLRMDGKPDKRCNGANYAQQSKDEEAKDEIEPDIKRLRKATIAFREGEISQQKWLEIRELILGVELAEPSPGGGDTHDESGIRVVPTSTFFRHD